MQLFFYQAPDFLRVVKGLKDLHGGGGAAASFNLPHTCSSCNVFVFKCE